MKKLNNLVFALLLIVCAGHYSVQAQSTPPNLPYYDSRVLHFGFILGYNQATANISFKNPMPHSDIILGATTERQSGFSIGVVSDLMIFKYLRLRLTPVISFCDRKINFVTGNNGDISTLTNNIETIWLEAPLEFKIQSKRWHNFRPYLIAGGKYAYDLASLKRKKTDAQDVLIKLDNQEFFYTLGFGFDFYLQYFKFGIELKTSFAANDILVRSYNTIYTDALDKFKSQVFYINFTFE
ncbi:MAG: PorT family protein [Bacteroidales bacterium]|jgi:hypothetical protein|nr:PorT family protein [Bacteroidales bacterium]